MAIKKNRIQDVEERNNKIEKMGLAELKQYLCMKNYQNPEKCKDCPGVKTCKAGQRAVLLLNEREITQMKDKKLTKEEQREVIRKRFIVVMGQPDMIQYLIDTDGNSRNAAREKLKHWAYMFPDTAEEYDFWNKLAGLSTKTLGHFKEQNYRQTEEAIERYKDAMGHDDPVAYVMQKYGWEKKQAGHNIRQWKQRYGEIKKEEPKDDEVSVEEFLKEFNGVVVPVSETETETEIKEITPPKLLKELTQKFNELEEEKRKLKERIAYIEKAQEALVFTSVLFDKKNDE